MTILLAAGTDATSHHLVTVAGGGVEPSLAEVKAGIPLRRVLEGCGIKDATGALMGGLFGGLAGPEMLDRRLGDTPLGCGAIHARTAADRPVDLAAAALAFLAAESWKQCCVCMSGTRALADTVAALAAGPPAGPPAGPAATRTADATGNAGGDGTAGIAGIAGTIGTGSTIGTAGIVRTAGTVGAAGTNRDGRADKTAGIVRTAGSLGTAGTSRETRADGTAGTPGTLGTAVTKRDARAKGIDGIVGIPWTASAAGRNWAGRADGDAGIDGAGRNREGWADGAAGIEGGAGIVALGVVARIERWAVTLPGRGACGLLDAAARIAGSLLPLPAGPNSPRSTMRLHVDPTKCGAYGLCAEAAPELIELDEWGYATVIVTADNDRAAGDAVAACPNGALRREAR